MLNRRVRFFLRSKSISRNVVQDLIQDGFGLIKRLGLALFLKMLCVVFLRQKMIATLIAELVESSLVCFERCRHKLIVLVGLLLLLLLQVDWNLLELHTFL